MTARHNALAVLIAAVWGVNFVVIHAGLQHFSPLLFSALRFTFVALPAVFLVGRPRVRWYWVAAIGGSLGVLSFGLLFVGIDQGLPAGLSSLVLQAQVIFTVAFAALALGERPRRAQLVGGAIALAGLAVIAADRASSAPLLPFVLVIGAAAAWGVANVCTRLAQPPDGLALMVWASLVAPLPLLLRAVRRHLARSRARPAPPRRGARALAPRRPHVAGPPPLLGGPAAGRPPPPGPLAAAAASPVAHPNLRAAGNVAPSDPL